MGTILGVLLRRARKDLHARLKKVETGGIGQSFLKKVFLKWVRKLPIPQKIYQKPEVQKHLIKGKSFMDFWMKQKKLTGMQSTVTGFKKINR